MASIQQSLNQLLGAVAGATTAGSYMYRQTPEYQRKAEIKQLERKKYQLSEASAELGSKAIDEIAEKLGKKPNELTAKDLDNNNWYEASAGKASVSVNENLAKTAERLLSIDPSAARAEDYLNYYTDIANYSKYVAEQNSAERLNQQTQSARDMLAGLIERKDLLSAKKRGQLNDIYHTIDKKGGFDN